MPHCIIEYSRPLLRQVNPEQVINVVQQGALESTLFEASHIKVRAMVYDDHFMGYPVDDFVHVTLKILLGRTQLQKNELSSLVLNKLEELELSSVSLTVEVVDMDRDSYAKSIIQQK